jgi:RsiW-degrading membrane proteinase PrsW (M82 family)
MRRPFLLCFCLLICANAFLAGCSTHLAGTNDAALEFTVDDDPTQVRLPLPQVVSRVKARLSAGQIAADVDATRDKRVRVVVDQDEAGAVDSLLDWRGGLSLYLADDSTALTPTNATLPDETHIAFAERLPTGEWRTRIARLPAIVDLGAQGSEIESIERADHGRSLALRFDAAGRSRLGAKRDLDPSATVVIARGRTLLATLPWAAVRTEPLVIPFGEDITSYGRAHNARRLLESPSLPPMHRAARTRLEARWSIGIACAVLPFALSFAWLLFVRRFDRARPEPMGLVAGTFALGGLFVVPAAIVELALSAATPWLDPAVATLGGQFLALPLALAVFTLVVGVVEETAKWLGVWSLAARRPEFDEPVDGIVYGCAAALGFAAVENIKYFALGRMSGVVIAVRAFMTVPAHMFFGAIWGYAMGRRLVVPATSVAAFVALAALAHGAFDTMLSIDGMQLGAALLVLALASLFIVLLRRALQHGVVLATSVRPGSQAEARTLLRVGSPFAFYASACGMIASAIALTVLGSAYELLHHRVGIVFVAMATATMVVFGAFAYKTSQAVPLDVVVDAEGVTFAGRRTPWSAIEDVDDATEADGKWAFVNVYLNDTVLRLGPAPEPRAREIRQAILGRLRAAPGSP